MSEKDMIERYIYEVVKRMPQEMREEIRMELQALIEDMCREEGGSVEEVLQKLGNPTEFAKRYRDDGNYVIGPEYYDNYCWILKIAIIGIAVSAVVSAVIQGITGAGNVVGFFIGFFAELFATALNGTYAAVGIVTIIFAVLERQKIKVNLKPEKNWMVGELTQNAAAAKQWTPMSLPPVPDKRALIGRGDSVVSIIFISIFGAIIMFAPQLFGAFRYNSGRIECYASVFNLEEWGTLAPILFFCLLVGLVDEIIRLVTGYYCKAVMYSSIICNSILIIGAVVLLGYLPFWNPDFAEQIREVAGIERFSSGDLLRYWGTGVFNKIILAGICAVSLIETGVTVYKTMKYAPK